VVAVSEPFAPGGGLLALGAGDRAAERLIRERVVEAVSRSLGDGRLLAPGGQDEERVRAIIDDEVAAYDRRAVTTNGPLLIDAVHGKDPGRAPARQPGQPNHAAGTRIKENPPQPLTTTSKRTRYAAGPPVKTIRQPLLRRVACEKCMIAHGAEIDWDQPGRSPYDRTHAEL